MPDKSITKAVASRKNIYDKNDKLMVSFMQCIGDLIDNADVQSLKRFKHHNTTRLQHSLNVSYYSFLIARKIGGDPHMAARAGLLHDLFLYDWRTNKKPQMHAFYHPKEAAANAKRITNITPREEDAILKHMWPLCKGLPAHRESVAVTIADKYAASMEIICPWSQSFLKKLRLVKS